MVWVGSFWKYFGIGQVGIFLLNYLSWGMEDIHFEEIFSKDRDGCVCCVMNLGKIHIMLDCGLSDRPKQELKA